MKKFVIPADNFKTAPLVIYDCSYIAMRRFLRSRFGIDFDDANAGCLGTMMTFDRAPWRVVWVHRIRKNNADDLATLAHELFHLTTRVCADKGVPIIHHLASGEVGDEAAAYLYEHYLFQSLKKLGFKPGE